MLGTVPLYISYLGSLNHKTGGYMSPELLSAFKGKQIHHHYNQYKSDVFSLGNIIN